MTQKTQQETEAIEVLDRARGFWEKNSRMIMLASSIVIVLIGGYLVYKYMFRAPEEAKAAEAIFRAEANFRKDSVQLALNGDGSRDNPGFVKVIKNYGSTPSGNLAKLYAGESYLQLGDYANAVKYLKDFEANGAKQVEANVYGLLGDAYSEQKKNGEAIENYKKAASTFDKDAAMASEYLFRAALLSEISGKNKEAIDLYQELKDKFPRTEKGYAADKYLARLGVTK